MWTAKVTPGKDFFYEMNLDSPGEGCRCTAYPYLICNRPKTSAEKDAEAR